MGKSFLRAFVLLAILMLFVAMAAQTVNALTTENVKTWYWNSNTFIRSVARGDVDGDGKAEIVTGGYCSDGTRLVAQLCVWDGATLALKIPVRTWFWTSSTEIQSVAVGDVDADGKNEIVTGGYFSDGTRIVAQLCVWDGATLTLENVKTWFWTNSTDINSVAIGDVDADGKNEIVTGGYFSDGTRIVAQLCVWDGATLTLENVKTWFWTNSTDINSVAIGDVDADGKNEIVTGGYYHESKFHLIAQLCVWDGATLALKIPVRTWDWGTTYYYPYGTSINSVAVGDVDADGKNEVVTGGYYTDGTRDVAQLCVWSGSTLALENVKTWYWTSHTVINSVAVGDVDGDSKNEIITGGTYDDGTRYVAQLCVWNGATLALENVKCWYWTSDTSIDSIAIGDVDGDSKNEIITGGTYNDGTRYVAQLCVWATWNIETVDAPASEDVGLYSSLALDSAGNPRISYFDVTNGNLLFAKWTGSAWGIQLVDSIGDVGYSSSLALDSSNNPHISYYDNTNKDLKYASWTGSAWSTQTVDSTGDVGIYTSLALDSFNRACIVYYDNTKGDLKYAGWTGSTWNILTVDSAGYVGSHCSLALDSGNIPHISYFDSTNGDLKYASWTGSGWSTQTVDSTGIVGYYTSLALDSAGNPHIAYRDVTNNVLKYASWSGSTWNIQTVASTGSSNDYISLALDSAGNPHIAYHDVTNNVLKYASWSGSTWNIQTVDAGWVGMYCSLALDSSNNPHISYQHLTATSGDLKYASFS